MSNFTEYDLQDAVRFQTTFTLADVPTDPTTVTLYVRHPSGVLDTFTYAASQITRPSAGVFYRDVEVDEAGEWGGRMVGDGAVNATAQTIVQVRRSVA
jgi:hypothetical protein